MSTYEPLFARLHNARAVAAATAKVEALIGEPDACWLDEEHTRRQIRLLILKDDCLHLIEGEKDPEIPRTTAAIPEPDSTVTVTATHRFGRIEAASQFVVKASTELRPGIGYDVQATTAWSWCFRGLGAISRVELNTKPVAVSDARPDCTRFAEALAKAVLRASSADAHVRGRIRPPEEDN